MTNEQTRVELPPLPEWTKRDDLGNFVPSDVRLGITAYATAAILADRERRAAKDAGAGDAEQVCAEAYQVVGSLLSDLGQFESDHAEKILDNLSQARMVHADVLPWPSFATPPAPAAPVSRAVREYARQLVERLENAARNCGNWHGMYQGKPMPHDVYEQFSSVRDRTIPELRAELLAILAATQQAEPSAKYLVCTGVVHEGEETYTVHDKPVPLADNWKLYTAPLASKEASPSAAEPELIAAARAVVARWHSPKWKDEAHTAEFIQRLERALPPSATDRQNREGGE